MGRQLCKKMKPKLHHSAATLQHCVDWNKAWENRESGRQAALRTLNLSIVTKSGKKGRMSSMFSRSHFCSTAMALSMSFCCSTTWRAARDREAAVYGDDLVSKLMSYSSSNANKCWYLPTLSQSFLFSSRSSGMSAFSWARPMSTWDK